MPTQLVFSPQYIQPSEITEKWLPRLRRADVCWDAQCCCCCCCCCRSIFLRFFFANILLIWKLPRFLWTNNFSRRWQIIQTVDIPLLRWITIVINPTKSTLPKQKRGKTTLFFAKKEWKTDRPSFWRDIPDCSLLWSLREEWVSKGSSTAYGKVLFKKPVKQRGSS